MLFFPTKEQGLEEVCFNADVSTNMLLPGRGKKETSRGSLVVCEEKEKKKKRKGIFFLKSAALTVVTSRKL